MTKRIFRVGSWIMVLALAVCLVVEMAWAKNPKDVVYVIGDSLSDNGNLYALIGFPPPPYDQRFSNGPVWVEYFAEQLRVGLEDLAYGGAFTGEITLPYDGGTAPFYNYINWAYGVPGDLPDVQYEVRGLIDSHPEGLNPDAIYVVWAGANDCFAALDAVLLDPSLLFSIPEAATDNIVGVISDLSAAGAKHFAVGNIPDLGLTPSARAFGIGALATQLSERFNDALVEKLTNLPPGRADTLVILDAFQFLHDLVSDPAAYGLENVTDPCFNSTTVCAEPDKYLFWDGVHPTTYGHSLFAERFRAAFCGTGDQHPGLRGRPDGQPPPIWRGACYGSK